MIRWFKQSFRRKLFAALLAVTLTLVILGGILTIEGFQARLRSDYMERDLRQQALIEDKVQNMLRTADETLSSIASNKSFVKAVETRTNTRDREIYNELFKETEAVREFGTVDIYIGNHRYYTTGAEEVEDELPLYYSVLREAAGKAGKTVYSLDFSEATESGSSLLMARQIAQIPAFAVIRISRESMEDVLREALGSGEGLILTNRTLRPFCMMGLSEDGDNLALVRSNLMKGNSYDNGAADNIYFRELPLTGLFLIYITPPVLDKSVIVSEYKIVLILVLVSTLLCTLVSSVLSVSISRPLKVIVDGMKRFRKGDMDVQVELEREDEFRELATGFNKTTVQIKEMMREQVEAEHRLNETRIAMMQAQLNPHFLYNTLDTIKWVAKANQIPEVATLSSNLAQILRGSISDSQFVTLERELQLVTKYCDIQRIRFDDRFDLETEVPGELMDCIIPKLLLQPIVENAIIHGLEERQDGHIRIEAAEYKGNTEGTEGTGRKEEDQSILVITVTDNGKGISDEMIRILQENDEKALSGHLGLNHVGTILKIYYGDDYGIWAEKLKKGDEITGTRMTIKLPVTREVKGKETA